MVPVASPCTRFLLAKQQLNKRGFTAAVLSEDRYAAALVHGARNTREEGRPLAVAEGDVVEAQQRVAHGVADARVWKSENDRLRLLDLLDVVLHSIVAQLQFPARNCCLRIHTETLHLPHP